MSTQSDQPAGQGPQGASNQDKRQKKDQKGQGRSRNNRRQSSGQRGASGGKASSSGKRGGGPAQQGANPYENRSGGQAIVTKRPVWNTGEATGPAPAEGGAPKQQAENGTGASSSGRGGKRRGGRGRGGSRPPAAGKNGGNQKKQEIRKNERGIFDFTEAELAEDTAIRLVSRSTQSDEVKYTSFEDYLKDH